MSCSLSHAKLSKVVYGSDNRIELEGSSKAHLGKSIAAMVSHYSLFDEGDGYSSFMVPLLTTYREKSTCEELRFRDQPTLSECSGFLIDTDLLVTAGHCVLESGQYANRTYTGQCSQNYWVFNYKKSAFKDEEVRFSYDDVYQCERVMDGAFVHNKDYAIIKLRRQTVNKTPVKLNLEYDYSKSKEIYVAGYPTGLPSKLSTGASFEPNLNEENTFTTSLDTFSGNSGSAIFNTEDEVIGILVSGEVDYYLDPNRDCYTVNTCQGINMSCSDPEVKEASGEQGTKISVLNRFFSNQQDRRK